MELVIFRELMLRDRHKIMVRIVQKNSKEFQRRGTLLLYIKCVESINFIAGLLMQFKFIYSLRFPSVKIYLCVEFRERDQFYLYIQFYIF